MAPPQSVERFHHPQSLAQPFGFISNWANTVFHLSAATSRSVSLWTICTDTCGLQQYTKGKQVHFSHLVGWNQQAARPQLQPKQELSQLFVLRLPTRYTFFKTNALQPVSPLCMYHTLLHSISALATRANGHLRTPWLQGLSPKDLSCRQGQKFWCLPPNWAQPNWALHMPARFSPACTVGLCCCHIYDCHSSAAVFPALLSPTDLSHNLMLRVDRLRWSLWGEAGEERREGEPIFWTRLRSQISSSWDTGDSLSFRFYACLIMLNLSEYCYGAEIKKHWEFAIAMNSDWSHRPLVFPFCYMKAGFNKVQIKPKAYFSGVLTNLSWNTEHDEKKEAQRNSVTCYLWFCKWNNERNNSVSVSPLSSLCCHRLIAPWTDL